MSAPVYICATQLAACCSGSWLAGRCGALGAGLL